MVEIECLICGQAIKIPEYIDTDDYDGQISCRQCTSIFHVVFAGSKLRKYEVAEKKAKTSIGASTVINSKPETENKLEAQDIADADVEKIAGYNPLRDYLTTYVATVLRITFDQIESIIGHKLETKAYTLKAWWENNNSHPQALSWLEAGWRVVDIDFPRRSVTFVKGQSENAG